MPFDAHVLDHFLRDYGKALATGDTVGIAACYTTPALMLHDGGSSAVHDRGDLIAAFHGIAERYQAAGLHEAVPTITRWEALSSELTSLDVDWTSVTAEGAPAGHVERYRYVVRDTAQGPRIQVVLTLPTGTAHR
jgi:hypothetical protein